MIPGCSTYFAKDTGSVTNPLQCAECKTEYDTAPLLSQINAQGQSIP